MIAPNDDPPLCAIQELLDGIRREGRPPLEWAVRWSRDRRDPIAAAWSEARDPGAMAELLELAGSADTPALIEAVINVVDGWPAGLTPTAPDRDADLSPRALVRLVDVIRAAAPPPSMAAVETCSPAARTIADCSLTVEELIDDLRTRGRPSLLWLVEGARSGRDPLSQLWLPGPQEAAWLLAVAAPDTLRARLVELRTRLREFELAYSSRQTVETNIHGADVTAESADRYGRLVDALDHCCAGDSALPAAELRERVAAVFDIARPGRPGSGTLWEFSTELLCTEAASYGLTLRTFLAAYARDPAAFEAP